MLKELLEHGVNVRSYAVKDDSDTLISRNAGIEVHTFTTPRGLSRVIGNEDYSVVFNLGFRFPHGVVSRMQGRLYGIYPSLLPEFRGEADPVKRMMKQKRIYGGLLYSN